MNIAKRIEFLLPVPIILITAALQYQQRLLKDVWCSHVYSIAPLKRRFSIIFLIVESARSTVQHFHGWDSFKKFFLLTRSNIR